MNKQKGFTLLEIVCVMALFLLVILLVGSMFILSQQTYRKGVGQGELVQNGRVALDRLSRELRQSLVMITDISSTSTPASELFFQDGHDPDVITYIHYYLDGTDLKRRHLAYYFPLDPSIYVFYNSIDAFGASPEEIVFEDRVVGEYFSQAAFHGSSGLVNIIFNLARGTDSLPVSTKVYVRNW